MSFKTPQDPFSIARQIFGNAVNTMQGDVRRNQENRQALRIRDEEIDRTMQIREEDRDRTLQDRAYELRLAKTQQLQGLLASLPPDSELRGQIEKGIVTLNNMGNMSGQEQLNLLPNLSITDERIVDETQVGNPRDDTPPTTRRTTEARNIPIEVLIGQAAQAAEQYKLALKEQDEAQSFERQLDFLKAQGVQEETLIAVRNSTAKDFETFRDEIGDANIVQAIADDKEREEFLLDLWKNKQLFTSDLGKEASLEQFYVREWESLKSLVEGGDLSENEARTRYANLLKADGVPQYIKNTAAISLASTEPIVSEAAKARQDYGLRSMTAEIEQLEYRNSIKEEVWQAEVEKNKSDLARNQEEIIRLQSINAELPAQLKAETEQLQQLVEAQDIALRIDRATIQDEIDIRQADAKIAKANVTLANQNITIGAETIDQMRIETDIMRISRDWSKTEATLNSMSAPRESIQRFIETGNYVAVENMLSVMADPSLNPALAQTLASANITEAELRNIYSEAVKVNEVTNSQQEYVKWQAQQAYTDGKFSDANQKLSLMQNLARVYPPDTLASILSGETRDQTFAILNSGGLLSDGDLRALTVMSNLNQQANELGIAQGYTDLENARLQGDVTRFQNSMNLYASAPADGDIATALNGLESSLQSAVESGLLNANQVQSIVSIYRNNWMTQNQNQDIAVAAARDESAYRQAMVQSTLATAWKTSNTTGGGTYNTAPNGIELGSTEWGRIYGDTIEQAGREKTAAWESLSRCELERSTPKFDRDGNVLPVGDCSTQQAMYDIASENYVIAMEAGLTSQNPDSTGLNPLRMNDGVPRTEAEELDAVLKWMEETPEFQTTIEAMTAGKTEEEAIAIINKYALGLAGMNNEEMDELWHQHIGFSPSAATATQDSPIIQPIIPAPPVPVAGQQSIAPVEGQQSLTNAQSITINDIINGANQSPDPMQSPAPPAIPSNNPSMVPQPSPDSGTMSPQPQGGALSQILSSNLNTVGNAVADGSPVATVRDIIMNNVRTLTGR